MVSATPEGRPLLARPAGVLFDYGQTLVTFERPDAALHAAYERISGQLVAWGCSRVDAGRLVEAVHDRVESAFAEHQRSGALEEIDLVGEALQAYATLGVRLSPQQLDDVLRIEQEAWWEGVRVDPEALPTLTALRHADVRVGLCSNAPYRLRSLHDQLAHVGLAEAFDAVTFSGAVGWRKPSPHIFEAALGALGTTPVDTVMVGDSLRDDIAGAQRIGMRGVLVQASVRDAPDDAPTPDATIAHLSELISLFAPTNTRL